MATGSKKTDSQEGFKMNTNVPPGPQDDATGSSFEAFLVDVVCRHQDKRSCGRWDYTFEGRHPDVTQWRAKRPSHVKPAHEGSKLVRYFGRIYYHAASRSIRVVAAADATPAEVEKLLVTAMHHAAAGTAGLWGPHPCGRKERVASVCRYIDEQYLEEALSALFETELSSGTPAEWARDGQQAAA